MPARLLAIDTSTELLSLGLADGAGVRVHEEPGGAQASAVLLPRLLALLQDARLRVADLDAIAFGRGPGAFTGLRTACSVAQGLALGADKPLLPVDTLLIVAECAREFTGATDVWAVQDARMGEVYAARYRLETDGWRTVQPPALYDPQTLEQRIAQAPAAVVAGNALPLHPALAGPATAVPQARPTAAALLALAEAAWRRGEAVDAAQALPLYIRDKVAFTTAEREAMREAG